MSPVLFLSSAALTEFDAGGAFSYLIPLLIAALVLGLIFRGIREKMQDLSQCFSAVISIGVIYLLALLAAVLFPDSFGRVLSPLPFLSRSGNEITMFPFAANSPASISNEILSMLLLAFAANVAGTLLPRGRKILSWLLLRLLTIILTAGIHGLVIWIFNTFLPGMLASNAPVVLLVVLAAFLLIGVLRFLLGLVLTIANPIIGAIYAFFFSNKVGKQLSKAVLSTILLSAAVFALENFGITRFLLSESLLRILPPVLAALLVLWYLTGKDE